MPSFTEWEARRRGGVAPQGAPDPVQSAAHEDDLTPGPLGEMRHATSGDDYTSAFMGELGRTGKEAAIGLARSPIDLVKGVANTVRHPLDTLMGIGHTAAHPVEAVTELAKHPRDAGSLLGQMLLAPKVPGAANTALAEGPSLAGRAIGAVGRGAEAVGTSRAMKAAGKFGVMESALRMDPKGMALAAAPAVLEHGGKLMQRGGAALEGLDLSLKENPFKRTPVVESALDPEADTVRETVKTARDLKGKGMSSGQAAQRAGWPLGESEEIPYRAGSGADIEGARGPEQAAANKAVRELAELTKGDGAWASDTSAQPTPKLSPIESFYGSDPQAKVGGEGRMTGQFEEGEGGLSSLVGAETRPLSPLDELSRLSGRGVNPARMQELLRKFGGVGS